ncbi:MAG TPA: ABC transporter permease [Chryseolinea sp.]|nr:ABC transporter permease [Chryseolinea sp.]
MTPTPPKWADRFLAWYCNPQVLEEIQGDAHELYFERLRDEGKRMADLKYIYDVLRFFRWSNIRGSEDPYKPSKWNMWYFNWKVAARTASRHKILYAIKTIGVSICLAFTLILTAFVIHELSYDEFNDRYHRIYRVTSRVDFHDHITHYAVTPLPIGRAMLDGIPEVERYTRFMYQGEPVFRVGDRTFYKEATLAADSSFLKVFSFTFLQGDNSALNQPNSVVLTETLAKKLFGTIQVMGKQLPVGEHLLLVSAVLKDVPANSHLMFDALISWDSFKRWDDWGNLNAYTYVQLSPDAELSAVKDKMPTLLKTFHELVAREYKATYEPVFEPLASIHFSEPLDEDIAQKGSLSNVFILGGVIALLLLMGLINYLNLSMAEVTTNLKKIGIIRIFGGTTGNHRRLLFADGLLAVAIILPVTALLTYAGWKLSALYLSIIIDPGVATNPIYWGLTAGSILLILFISQFNALIFSRPATITESLKGMFRPKRSGQVLRNILVGLQFTSSIAMIALILVTIDQFNFIQDSDKGFEAHNVVLVKLRDAQPQKVVTFIEQLREVKGVSKVDGSTYAPGVLETKYVFQVESEQGMTELLVPMIACGYDYFDALNIRLSAGRNFDESHRDGQGAFIINETAAREFGWTNAIGKRIAGPVEGGGEPMTEGEVIGVVHDFNFASLHSKIEPMIVFLAPAEWPTNFVYIKTHAITSPDLISSIKSIYDKQWEEYPFEWEYLDTQYLSLYKKDRQVRHILEVGLIISILIAGLGIFSISALLANLRAKEMGIRKVVGATGVQLFFLHIRSFMLFLMLCVVIACPLIYALSHLWLRNFAYRIPLSAYHFLMPGALAGTILVLTVGYHALKGTRTNPVEMLKYE